MNIEEAVEWLEIIKEGYEYGDIDSAVTIKGYKRCVEAIETVLNELDKKDKVIDFMANSLTTDYHDTEWVKEYYYKLVEGNIDKK